MKFRLSSLSHVELKELLHYDPKTGLWTWLRTGRSAGYTDKNNIKIKIKGHSYTSQRLAWFYMKGIWPNDRIMHLDKNRFNNRWNNLRESTDSEIVINTNYKINSTGMKGVYRNQKTGWGAKIQINHVRKHLGYFRTPQEASNAYQEAAKKYHGDFAQ